MHRADSPQPSALADLSPILLRQLLLSIEPGLAAVDPVLRIDNHQKLRVELSPLGFQRFALSRERSPLVLYRRPFYPPSAGQRSHHRQPQHIADRETEHG